MSCIFMRDFLFIFAIANRFISTFLTMEVSLFFKNKVVERNSMFFYYRPESSL